MMSINGSNYLNLQLIPLKPVPDNRSPPDLQRWYRRTGGDDAELVKDSLLGALSDSSTMGRFNGALLSIPGVKDKLLVLFLPPPDLQNSRNSKTP